MARGGVRQGAGRKPGAPTRFNEEARAKAAEEGTTPLAYLLGIMRDETKSEEVRIDVAKAAAPYLHARLSSIEAKHDVSDSLSDLLKAVDGKTRGIPTGR